MTSQYCRELLWSDNSRWTSGQIPIYKYKRKSLSGPIAIVGGLKDGFLFLYAF